MARRRPGGNRSPERTENVQEDERRQARKRNSRGQRQVTEFFDPSDHLEKAGYVIDVHHIPTGRSVAFKAWVTSFSDAYTSNWNTEDTYGRMDPITTFQNTTRTISIEWDVVASSVTKAKEEMQKCELLLSMLYPTYEGHDNASSIKAAPLFRLKYVNLISAPNTATAGNAKTGGLVGTFSGLTYSPDFDAGFFAGGGKVYPQLISLSAEFKVLHHFKVGWDDASKKFREGGFPYGGGPTPQAPYRSPPPSVSESSDPPMTPVPADNPNLQSVPGPQGSGMEPQQSSVPADMSSTGAEAEVLNPGSE